MQITVSLVSVAVSHFGQASSAYSKHNKEGEREGTMKQDLPYHTRHK
jgi:hypothetical protein